MATCFGGSGAGLGGAFGAGGSGASAARGGGAGGVGRAGGAGGLAGFPRGALSSGLSGAMSTKIVSPFLARAKTPNRLNKIIVAASTRWRTIEQMMAMARARRAGSSDSLSLTI